MTLDRALPRAFSTLPLVLLATLATAGPSAPPAGSGGPAYEPDLEIAENLKLSGATWTREEPTHVVHLRQVDSAERLRYIRGATGVAVDPFAAPPGQTERFLTFLIVIENHGDTPLSFNALDCWLTTNRKEIATPLGLTDLSFDYQIAGKPLPAAYERISPVMLDGTRLLAPGAKLSGLLVYRLLDARTKRFHLDVELTPPSGDELRMRAPYRKIKQDPGEGEDPS